MSMKNISQEKKDMINLSRRSFMVGSVKTSLFMAFGAAAIPSLLSAKESIEAKQFSPNIWFEMDTDGNVTVNIAKAEMGQHIGTPIARILADELECDWEKVSIVHVDTDPKWGYMVTGGSWSIFHTYKPMSQAGAAGRMVLIDAGAKLLGVPADSCKAEKGFVISGNKKISYGDIVANGKVDKTFSADELAELPIKPGKKRHLIGVNADYKVLDIPPKTNGTAVYGIDVEVENMLYARPILPPTRYGSTVTNVDDSKAKSLPGYKGYKVLTDPSGTIEGWVTVLATDYPTAIKAVDMVKVGYNAGKTANVSEADIQKEGERIVRDRKEGTVFVDEGNIELAQTKAAQTIEALYTTATANHFQLEPLNAIAEFKGGKWHIHTGNQWQSLTLPTVAKAAEVPESDVVLHQYYLGGGFGRRLFGDWVVPALLTAKAAGQPVKLVFMRPDDTLFDQPRSASTSLFNASFDENNQFLGMEHALAAGWPTLKMAPGFLAPGVNGEGKVDMFSASGADHWYTMSHHRARAVNNKVAQDTFTPGWLRSVGQGWIVWGLESFIDEVAVKANKDPVDFRLAMLDGKGKQGGKAPESVGGATRLANTLEILKKKTANVKLGADEGIGYSVSAGQERTMPAWLATAAHVHVNKRTGKITVKKLWVVSDAGIVIHPDGAMAQLEGSLLWGLSLALFEHNEVKNGQVSKTNLHTYLPLRMNDVPEMDIELVESEEFPVGLGEPGVIGVAPAIGNAVYQAIGVRLRHLPMLAQHVTAALKA